MINFEYQNTTKIIFGRDTEKQVGQEIKKYGKKVLLHYGSGSIKKSGLYERVTNALVEAGVTYVELGGVKPNPRVSLVREGIEMCKKENIDCILAVGGGSVIDSAKAIGIGVKAQDHDVWSFYTGEQEPMESLPVGVILTIAAAGSESSKGSVITNEEGWYKRSCNADCMYPEFAILNPELTYTLPEYQTVCGIADIMAHIMERYFTQVHHTECTDRLCEATMKTVIDNAKLVIRDPENYDARAEIMWAGTLAHNNLLGTGRIGDWASHAIEHELSGMYDIAHGAGLAIVLPAWMQYVYQYNVARFVQFAVRVWNVDMSYDDEEMIALEGISKMKEFFRDLGLPVSLIEENITTEYIEELAEKATEQGAIGNFVKLEKEDIEAILVLAK